MTATQVARILGEKYGIKVDSSTLYNYEGGTVFAPDPGVLWGLAKLYDVDLEEMLTLLVMNRANQDAETLELQYSKPNEVRVHADDLPFIEYGRAVSGVGRKRLLEVMRLFVDDSLTTQRLIQAESAKRRAANE